MEPDTQPKAPGEEPAAEQTTPQQAPPVVSEQSFNQNAYSTSEPMTPASSEPSNSATTPLPPDQNVVTPTTPSEAPTPTVAAASSASKTSLWLWISLGIVVLAAVGVFVYVYVIG